MAGALLVERGLASPAQVAEALEQQRAGGEFEEIMTSQFGLGKADVRAALSDKEAAGRVDVGLLLLATGVVGEEHLAEARDRSAATGQPVGPILVEMGAISRLDLASALADQWSGSPAQIIPSPTRGRNSKTPTQSDELREAMAALEASIRVARGGAGDGVDALDEVLRREAELTARLVALEQVVAHGSEPDPALAAEIHGIAQGLGALQASLETVASTDDLVALERAIGDLGTLRTLVDQLTEGLAGAATTAAVDALEARVTSADLASAAVATRVETVEAGAYDSGLQLASLVQRVDQLEPLVPRATELAEQLEIVRGSVASLSEGAARSEELATTVASLAPLADRIDGLASAVEEVRAGLVEPSGADAELANRLDVVCEEFGAIQQRIGALDVLPSDVATLRKSIEQLTTDGKPDAKLAKRVEALGARVEALSVEALGPAAEAAVAGVAGRVDAISAAQSDAIGRLEELVCVVDELRSFVESRGGAEVADLDALVAQIEERVGTAAPEAALTSLVASIDEVRDLHGSTAERLAIVDERLSTIADDAEGARRSADDALGAALHRVDQVGAEVGGRLDEMLGRITRLEEQGVAPQGEGSSNDGLREEIAALGAALTEAQASFVEDLKRVQAAWDTERAALESLILGRGSEAPEGTGGSPESAELVVLNRQLERMNDRLVEQERSLVEHFARRERALIEKLGGGNDVGQRLSELTLGLDDLRGQIQRIATSGGGGSGNGADIAEVKEALFSRMERLATSMDWRFQRLEGGPADAAGRSDLQVRLDELANTVQRLAAANGVDVEQAAPAGEMFLALVPSTTGHQLIELAGSTPEQGARIPSPFGDGELEVVAIGTSPLPGDERPCVFVEQAEVATSA